MKTMVFTFGRFQPPTLGHVKLIQKVLDTAAELNADHYILVSNSVDNLTNPLDVDTRIRMLEKISPTANIENIYNNPFIAFEDFGNNGYEKVILVAGSDREYVFRTAAEKYAGSWGVKEFSVLSAGDRIIGKNDKKNISATWARDLAGKNDFKGFCKLLPNELSDDDKQEIFDKIRSCLFATV